MGEIGLNRGMRVVMARVEEIVEKEAGVPV